MEMETVYATLAEMYETRTRDNGETFVTLRDDVSEDAQAFNQEAHGADMLPDDWRYSWIPQILELLADGEDPEDLGVIADQLTDVYNGRLLAWVGSNLDRMSYCDEVLENGQRETFASILMQSQYMEIEELAQRVVQAAEEYAESVTAGSDA